MRYVRSYDDDTLGLDFGVGKYIALPVRLARGSADIAPSHAGGLPIARFFFCRLMVVLAPPVFVQAAAGLCPDEGGPRGRVASVNERLELTLESGIRLKIAGVDPPRPTPGDPDLDVRRARPAHSMACWTRNCLQPVEPSLGSLGAPARLCLRPCGGVRGRKSAHAGR